MEKTKKFVLEITYDDDETCNVKIKKRIIKYITAADRIREVANRASKLFK